MSKETTAPLSRRLASLDAFRGMTIVAMLWVNNMAAPKPLHQFTHAKWNQLITLCDLIFPWFLFITGVALAFSIAARRGKGASELALAGSALKRSFLLFALGAILDSSINKRFTFAIGGGIGVLQTIAISYLIATVFYRLNIAKRLTLVSISLVLYYVAFRFVGSPGSPVDTPWFTQNANFASWVNTTLAPYGLKGLVTSWPASALVLLGTCIGDVMRDKQTSERTKTLRLCLAAGALLVLAIAWHFLFPMSKFVFSSSYVLFAAGTGCLVLAAFHFVMDVVGFRAWALLFTVYGVNAIAAYFLSIFLRIHTVQEWMVTLNDGTKVSVWNHTIDLLRTSALGTQIGGYTFTAGYVLLWGVVLAVMHHKKLYWRV